MHSYPLPFSQGKLASINSFYNIHKLSLCSFIITFRYARALIYKLPLVPQFFDTYTEKY